MMIPRVPETNSLLLDRTHIETYDRMQASLRDNGWLETEELLKNGITSGYTLEAGSGPGYLGLDWLSRTTETRLVGLDISPDMIALAKSHAREAGLGGRAEYFIGSVEEIPFGNDTFNAVFSSRSLHEWVNPCIVFTEFWRVLKPGGKLYLSDLRRDLSRPAISFLERRMTSEGVLEALRASVAAAYVVEEVSALLGSAKIGGCEAIALPLGLRVTATKLF
jgi:ubiquinone/menaquinone biosynthesis C-methylase UbiE